MYLLFRLGQSKCITFGVVVIEWWKTLCRIWCFGVYSGSCQL